MNIPTVLLATQSCRGNSLRSPMATQRCRGRRQQRAIECIAPNMPQTSAADFQNRSYYLYPNNYLRKIASDRRFTAAFVAGHGKRPKTSRTHTREERPERTGDAQKASWGSSGDVFASSHAAPSAEEEENRTQVRDMSNWTRAKLRELEKFNKYAVGRQQHSCKMDKTEEEAL